jgi:copper(I)-binding protein
VASPAANVVELHEMVMDNNVMKMRALPRLEVQAGKPLELKPGSYHVMLIDLKKPSARAKWCPSPSRWRARTRRSRTWS